jgi:hypothetical protein
MLQPHRLPLMQAEPATLPKQLKQARPVLPHPPDAVPPAQSPLAQQPPTQVWLSAGLQVVVQVPPPTGQEAPLGHWLEALHPHVPPSPEGRQAKPVDEPGQVRQAPPVLPQAPAAVPG